jgi:hypothetical protein
VKFLSTGHSRVPHTGSASAPRELNPVSPESRSGRLPSSSKLIRERVP